MTCPVTVLICRTFPWDHRSEMFRLQCCNLPLVDCVIRNTVKTNFTARPFLTAGPLDGIGKILSLSRRKYIEITRRTASATRINPYTGIAPRNPYFRINGFPSKPTMFGTGKEVGMHFKEWFPQRLIVFLVLDTFSIWTAGHDNRYSNFCIRAINVNAQCNAVVHFDG